MQPLVLAAEEDAGDVLVVELGGGAGLLVEAADVLGVAGHLRRQDLQGDDAVELRVAGPQHGGHAADADRLDQLEVGESPAANPGVVDVGSDGSGVIFGNDRGGVITGRRGGGQDIVLARWPEPWDDGQTSRRGRGWVAAACCQVRRCEMTT